MIIHIIKLFCLLILIAIVFVAWILLCPVKYQGNINISEKKGDLSIHYLLRMIRFRIMVDDGVQIVLYLLFKKFDFTDPEFKRKQKIKKQKKLAKKKAKLQRKKERERRKWLRKHGRQERNTQQNVEHNELLTDHATAGDTEHTSKDSKLNGLKRNLPKIKKIWNSLRETELITVLTPKILKLIGRIAPKKISGEIDFGFEDPSVTGKVVGAVAMLPFLYTTQLRICPDFECEEKYCTGSVSLSGQLRIIHLVLFVVSCLREKRVRRFIKLIRMKDKSEKK